VLTGETEEEGSTSPLSHVSTQTGRVQPLLIYFQLSDAAWDATRGGIPLLGVFLSTQTRRVQGEQGGFDATRRAHLLVISFQWGGFNTLPICFHCHPEGSIPPFSEEGSFSPLLNIILYLYYVYT